MGGKSTRQQIKLAAAERGRLAGILNSPQSFQKHVWRAHIIYELGSGRGLIGTVKRTGTTKPTGWRWQDRFLEEGADGFLHDAARPPGKDPIPEARVKALIDLAMSPPPPHTTHWTLKALFEAMGDMSVSSVRNILARNRLRPHQMKTFKVSAVRQSGKKTHDVVGLYVNPPDHAVVLSVDEKTQIQALGRNQNPLPMKAEHPETRTNDYKRNGTSCLMAALDIATGKVTGQTVTRHRSKEFLEFLDLVNDGIAPGSPVHVILDNVPSRKSAEVYAWLAEHPDWTFHFTPTSAYWMNAVEGFFARLARQRLRHSVFNSLEECTGAIEAFIRHHNENKARKFKWSRQPADLAASWKRGYRKLEA